jgi:hypothetical protein
MLKEDVEGSKILKEGGKMLKEGRREKMLKGRKEKKGRRRY